MILKAAILSVAALGKFNTKIATLSILLPFVGSDLLWSSVAALERAQRRPQTIRFTIKRSIEERRGGEKWKG